MKLYVDQLIIEVGRKCNLKCAHCLRGEAQDAEVSFDAVKALLDNVDEITTLTFTGGEPSLYAETIDKIVNYIIENDIELYNFYVATNAVKYSPVFVNALIKLYAHCYEKDMCQLDISDDGYHREWYECCGIKPAYDFYEALSFTSKRGEITHLVKEGRADRYGDRVLKYEDFNITDMTENSVCVEMLYLTAKGKVISDCDFSFERADKHPYAVDVTNIKSAFAKKIKTA